jgi:GAF domain-containing protein
VTGLGSSVAERAEWSRLKEVDVRLRLIAPVLLVLAVTAGAFVLTRMDSTADAWFVLATGLALAAVTATAISNAGTRHSLALLADEQAALRRVATLVARESSPVETFQAVTEEASRVLQSEAVGLLRFDPGEMATLVAQSDTPWDPPPLGTRFTLDGENVVAEVFRTGRAARADDWTGSTGAVAAMATVLGVRSAVASPVVVEGRLWGTIIAATSQREPLPAETDSRIAQFTALVATAIANAEARGELARLAEEQAALRRVAVLVAQQPSPDEVFTAVTEAVGPLLGADLSAMHVFRGDDAATVVASWTQAGPTLPIGTWLPLDGDSAVARIFRTRAAARIDGYTDTEGGTAEVARELRLRTAVGAPILVEGKLWGALMAATRGEEPLPEDAETRIAAFTQLVATAVSNAQARGDLHRLADEQAALRRVATQVARGIGPEEVFRAVAAEVGVLFGADVSAIVRFEDDGMVTVLGDVGGLHASGKRVTLDEGYVVHRVRETSRSARFDTDDPSAPDTPSLVRALGIRSSVASPIVVQGELWGAITAASVEGALAASAERRLTEFTELVATAIANTQAREQVTALADDQAALRRVATLVATEASHADVFNAIAEGVAGVLGEELRLVRYEGDHAVVVAASDGPHNDVLPVGSRIPLGGENAISRAFRTGAPVRIDDYSRATGAIAEAVRPSGVRSAVATPIGVEGQRWGAMLVGTFGEELVPPDTERRLSQFSELMATAIANTEARVEIERLADEQAALRRVATLVARRVAPEVVFQAVADEAGGLLGADIAALVRFESDDTVRVMAGPRSGPYAAGDRVPIDPGFVVFAVRETGQPARFQTDDPAAEEMPDLVRRLGFRSAVASPIVVEETLWGAAVLGSFGESFAPDTEHRLDEFTELVATAVSNATARAELVASRARIVAAGDQARRRIERNLHDGTQQRLVSLGLAVRSAEAGLPPDQDDLRAQLSGVATGLVAAVEDLQEISRGIHPAILSKGGLAAALRTLAHRSAIPVDLDIGADVRLAEPIEVAAYFVASEALANAAKHSQASRIDIAVEQGDGRLRLSVRDDGVGGADAVRGSGLIGLTDRVEALGGSLHVSSRPGLGTQITAELPLELELSPAAG